MKDFSLSYRSSFGENRIFVADMNLSLHIDDKKRDMLILGTGSTYGLDDATLTEEKKMFYKFYWGIK